LARKPRGEIWRERLRGRPGWHSRTVPISLRLNYAQEDGSIMLNYAQVEAQTKDQLRSRGWLNYAQEDGSIMLKRMAQLCSRGWLNYAQLCSNERSIMLKRKINYAQEDGSIHRVHFMRYHNIS